jgi:hypothetical protein
MTKYPIGPFDPGTSKITGLADLNRTPYPRRDGAKFFGVPVQPLSSAE